MAKKNDGFGKPPKNLCAIFPEATYSSRTKTWKGFTGFNVPSFLSRNNKAI
jgi:hypothetical protein